MIYFCIQRLYKTFQNANTTLNILKTVGKICEKVLTKVEHDLVAKVKVENFIHSRSHIAKQVLTSISVDMRSYQPLLGLAA